RHRSLVPFALAAALFVASCDKPAPPPPPPPAQVQAPKPAAPTVNEEMKRLAAEVYVYAFPLVVTDVTRQVQSARTQPNTFLHRRTLVDTGASAATPLPNL